MVLTVLAAWCFAPAVLGKDPIPLETRVDLLLRGWDDRAVEAEIQKEVKALFAKQNEDGSFGPLPKKAKKPKRKAARPPLPTDAKYKKIMK